MNYLIAQILGIVAFIISLAAYHRKEKTRILGSMIISNIFNLIHYSLLEAYSGYLTKIIAILRDCIIIRKDKYNKNISNFILIIFLFSYLLVGIFTYKNILSLFPIFSAIIYIIPIWNGNVNIMRKAALLGDFLWFIYNIYVLSIPGILAKFISIISIIIAIKNTSKESI